MEFSDFLPLVGSGIGAVANAIAGNAANKTNLRIARETNQAQMDLARYQADRNLDLWNLNNAYNTPAEQMKRYQEAGLNPNLIYGNGSASSGSSSSPAAGFDAPKLQRAQVDNSYVANSAQMLMNGLSQSAQIRKTDAETALLHQNAVNAQKDEILKDLTAIRFRLENEKTEVGREFWQNEYISKLSELDSRATLNWANAQNTDTDRFLKEAQLPFVTQMYQSQIDKLLSDISLNKSRKRGSDIENSMKRSYISAQIANLLASADLSNSNTDINKITARIKSILLDSGLDINGDEFDRMLYSSQRGSTGGKAINSTAKTILSFLSALLH